MNRRIVLRHAAALMLACAALVTVPSATAQVDTSGASVEPPLRQNHAPRGALWRAAAAPGWGQIYNRQYYKLPIVWGGFVGIAGSALYVNRRYLVYRHAFLWLVRDRATQEVPASYESDYLQLVQDLGLSPDEAEAREGRLTDLFRQNRDNLRRNRDLLYIGLGLFYGLTIIDAYVSAHLLDFDVSEDLTLSVHPAPGGVSARLRFGR